MSKINWLNPSFVVTVHQAMEIHMLWIYKTIRFTSVTYIKKRGDCTHLLIIDLIKGTHTHTTNNIPAQYTSSSLHTMNIEQLAASETEGTDNGDLLGTPQTKEDDIDTDADDTEEETFLTPGIIIPPSSAKISTSHHDRSIKSD